MKFSTRTTYGLRAMISLAKHWQQGSLPLVKIAQQEDISQKYLERIFAQLKKAELVKSEIGANGGYALTKNPTDIKIYDIVKVLEGDMNLFHCLNEAGEVFCSNNCHCGANAVLIKVQQAILTTLNSMKLSDLD